jgi:hypothetical protein
MFKPFSRCAKARSGFPPSNSRQTKRTHVNNVISRVLGSATLQLFRALIALLYWTSVYLCCMALGYSSVALQYSYNDPSAIMACWTGGSE